MRKLTKAIQFAATIALALNLSACFEERVVVKVKSDGSGVIEHRSYNSAEDMMSSMFEGMVEEGAAEAPTTEGKYNQQYFEDRAKEMGEGVSVKEYQLEKNAAGFPGYRALYAYTDINKLNIDSGPSSEGDESGSPVSSDALASNHHFSMKDKVLSIHTPDPDSGDVEATPEDAANEAMAEQMISMMAAMLKGARVSVEVEALDAIAETNAHHLNGNTITLMDVQIDKLLQDPKTLTQAQKLRSMSREDAQKMADSTDGVDVDTQETVTVKFK